MLGTGAFEGIDPEQQFDKIVVNRVVDALHDEGISAANILTNADEHVPFTENLSVAGSQLDSQFVRDFLSEYRVSGPCEDREISLSRLERLHAGTSAAVS